MTSLVIQPSSIVCSGVLAPVLQGRPAENSALPGRDPCTETVTDALGRAFVGGGTKFSSDKIKLFILKLSILHVAYAWT